MIGAVLALMFSTWTAMAQQVWIQIEAQPGLRQAEEAASRYARRIENVNGFRLGATNWYAIALGPFSAEDATRTRSTLRRQGLIPGDAFTTDGASFRARFWPIGGGSLQAPAPVVPNVTQPTEPVIAAIVDETPAQARRSEAALDRAARQELQIALEWAGFYDAAIDGAFGRGTRAAMGAWQVANGFRRTGVLTTAQRAALLRDYNAVLDGLGLELVRDDVAGIAIEMPTALVELEAHEPPFARYGARKDGDAHRVLLISQAGNQATLFGLYDILQTLEIVPMTGPRERRAQGFTLTGKGRDFVSHTEVRLRDGHVKGFMLIWPNGDEERRLRLLDRMLASFAPQPGVVMQDQLGDPDEDQRIDLLAGLQVRVPVRVRSGFYVDRRGWVLTTADVVQQCGRVTLNGDVEARVVAEDAALNMALLAPEEALAPRSAARFQARVPRLKSEVVLSGYPFDGVLGAPSLTYGTLADLRGLDGDETIKRVDLAAQPGDAGGPVFDPGGAVLGMMLPRAVKEGRVLPEAAGFVVDVETIVEFLGAENIAPAATDTLSPLPVAELTRQAGDMTVLVGCWN